jgi:hypothetical protein
MYFDVDLYDSDADVILESITFLWFRKSTQWLAEYLWSNLNFKAFHRTVEETLNPYGL